MKPKRIFLLTFLCILSFLIVGCGDKTTSKITTKPTNNTTKTKEVIKTTSNTKTNIITTKKQGEDVKKNEYYNPLNFVASNDKVEDTDLVIYDGPEYLDSSSTTKVRANSKDVFVYETRVNHGTQFSWMVPSTTNPVALFDFKGKVHVEIEVEEEVESAIIRPLIYGITPKCEGNIISFDLEYATNYVVEYNGNSDNAVHLLTSVPKDILTEEEALSLGYTYIGPGVYKADAIPVSDNATIYLAGGAYVYGQIRAEGLNNVTIKGRGIISGSIYNRRSESEYTIPIEMRSCDGVLIEGITILDPAGWTIALYKSKNVELNDVKIITARQNGDGISVQSCENVRVIGGFVRSWDDSLVVKNVDGSSTKNILFDGVTVWTDLAQSMEVGYEANGEKMEGIKFHNITVLHNFHKAVISMHNADDAQIEDVEYKNITVEDAQMLGDNRTDGENDFLIDLCVLYNIDWSKSTNIKGTVKNVLIENVKVYQTLDTIVSRINGYSPTSNISGVTIKNVEIAGKKINSVQDLGLLTNDYASNISVSYDNDPLGSYISLPYDISNLSENVNINEIENVIQEGMMVPLFARSKGDAPYIGVATNYNGLVNATHSAGTKTTTEPDDGSGDFTKDGYNSSNVADKNYETTWKNGEWKDVDDEFAALTVEFGGDKLSIGVIRLLGNQDNEAYYTYTFQVWGKKIKSDGTVNNKYTRILSISDYEMSPGSNNCIDVNITTQEYAGIQIRFYKGSLPSSPEYYEISEIEFFAPSLSYNKAIVYSTEHNDVYTVEKLVDGDATNTSYYESASLPAEIVIDLGDIYSVNTFVMCLPPSLKWDARNEEIEILVSSSNSEYSSSTVFTTVVAKTKYLFDPQDGNRNIVKLDNNVDARFVKIIIYSNDNRGGYNAQLSEFSVYGEKK